MPPKAGGGDDPSASPPPRHVGNLLDDYVKDLKTVADEDLPKTQTTSRRRAHRITNERKARVIGHVADGCTVKEAVAKVGAQYSSYTYWRQTDDEFKANVDAAKLAERKTQTYDGSFASFRKVFFDMDSYYHHLRIVDALESAKPMSITMILCPPMHGKTSVIEDWICYKVALDPNIRITVVSEGQDHAKKIISRVQGRMTDTAKAPAYIGKFGPFHVDGMERKGKPWTSEYMKVFRSDADERDFSLESRGSTSAIAGTRTDLLIVDDIQSRKNYGQTQKLVETFQQDFLTRPGTEGRVVVIGTRVDTDDFYERLIDQGIIDELVQLPATDWNEQVECPLGEKCDVPDIAHERALCPEMWPSHQLAKKRKQVTDPVWWRNYQQKPRAAGNATFTEKMVDDAKDHMRTMVAPPATVTVAAGLDPAISGGAAHIVASLFTDKIEILDCVIDFGAGSYGPIFNRMESLALTYRPSLYIIETDTMQKAIARADEVVSMTERFKFRVIEHLTRGQKSDPQLGVALMAGGFERGEIRIPYGDDYAKRHMEPLIAELLSWRSYIPTKKLKQDAVMALWFVWKYWMETRRALEMDDSAWKRPGLPWSGMRREAAVSARGTFRRSA